MAKIKTGIKFTYAALRNMALDVLRITPMIKHVTFEITDLCNSRCGYHCNIWQSKPKSALSLPEIERIFSDGIFRQLESIIITGGEAVLREDLSEIILALHRIRPGVGIALSTNGLLPERVISAVKKALEAGVNISVGVSLDAIGERHDQIRGVVGNFEKADRLLKELVKLRDQNKGRPGIVIGHTLSSHTYDTIQEVKRYADGLGICFLTQLCETFPYYNLNNKQHSDLVNASKETVNLVREINKLPPSIHNEILESTLKGSPNRFRCDSLKSFLLLRCNGDVMPCLNYSTMKVGNFRDEPPSAVWRGESIKEARKTVRKCNGCANTWANDWSMSLWYFPFIALIAKVSLKKICHPRR